MQSCRLIDELAGRTCRIIDELAGRIRLCKKLLQNSGFSSLRTTVCSRPIV